MVSVVCDGCFVGCVMRVVLGVLCDVCYERCSVPWV